MTSLPGPSATRRSPASSCPPGCQDGLGVLAHSLSGTSHVAVTRTSVSDYGKNGITCRDTGTICDISHDTVTGSGPDPVIAQNGVEIAFGAGGTVRGNTITGNECDDTAGGCGPDPLTGVQATGVLVFNYPSPTPGRDISRPQHRLRQRPGHLHR